MNKNMEMDAKIEVYEVTYEHGLLTGKTIYYTITTTDMIYKVSAAWDKYEDFSITLANFVRYNSPEVGEGFTYEEVLDFINNNDECYYDVAEFVDMLKERME